MDTTEDREKLKASQINNALGFFILIFGLIVVFAMFFTETFVQKMTDLVAGITLAIIGAGMMWRAKKVIKKLNSKKE
jgi:putative Mn2+ efflux pump MntP